MALQICKECGGQVATDAKFCPHCGSSGFDTPVAVKKATTVVISCGCMTIILVFVLLVIGSMIAGSGK
jgi:ribosomal protein L40E